MKRFLLVAALALASPAAAQTFSNNSGIRAYSSNDDAVKMVCVDVATNAIEDCAGGAGGSTNVAATAAAPTWTEGSTSNQISGDLHGSLRVTILDDAGVAVDWATVAPAASTSAEACHVFKASAGDLYSASGYIGAAGFIMVFNATSAPADGAVTPVAWAYAPAAGSWSISYDTPARFSTGITICASSTGPLTKTAYSTNTVHSAQVK